MRFLKQYGAMYGVALALIVGFVGVQLWDPPPLQVARLKTFDFYQRAHPREDKPYPVIIVDIDEESLDAYGQWPWPRTLFAKLIKTLMDGGVASIGFDIVFAEPDRSSPENFVKTVDVMDESTRRLIEDLPRNDSVFADALRNSRVVLGQSTTSRRLPYNRDEPPLKFTLAQKGGDAAGVTFNFLGITRNLPELEDAAQGLGMFTLKPEIDGVVRRVPLFVRVGKDLVQRGIKPVRAEDYFPPSKDLFPALIPTALEFDSRKGLHARFCVIQGCWQQGSVFNANDSFVKRL